MMRVQGCAQQPPVCRGLTESGFWLQGKRQQRELQRLKQQQEAEAAAEWQEVPAKPRRQEAADFRELAVPGSGNAHVQQDRCRCFPSSVVRWRCEAGRAEMWLHDQLPRCVPHLKAGCRHCASAGSWKRRQMCACEADAGIAIFSSVGRSSMGEAVAGTAAG